MQFVCTIVWIQRSGVSDRLMSGFQSLHWEVAWHWVVDRICEFPNRLTSPNESTSVVHFQHHHRALHQSLHICTTHHMYSWACQLLSISSENQSGYGTLEYDIDCFNTPPHSFVPKNEREKLTCLCPDHIVWLSPLSNHDFQHHQLLPELPPE